MPLPNYYKLNEIEVLKILEKNDLCRLALSYKNYPYIIPMCYGYKYENSKLTLYLCSRTYGQKMYYLALNPHVCIELDVPKTSVDEYPPLYDSVVISGNVYKVCDKKKIEDIKNIVFTRNQMNQTVFASYNGNNDFCFLEVVVNNISGRRYNI